MGDKAPGKDQGLQGFELRGSTKVDRDVGVVRRGDLKVLNKMLQEVASRAGVDGYINQIILLPRGSQPMASNVPE